MEKTKAYGGHSMAGELRRVIVCSPRVAGWEDGGRAERWKQLGYFHLPDGGLADAQHQRLVEALEGAGSEVVSLTDGNGLSLDAVYAHDASFMTDYGPILMRMGKAARRDEPERHAALYRSLEVPLLGEIREPGTAEAGDIVWLDPSTLLVGRGYRTNAAGIDQLRALLDPKGVEVIEAPLPHGQGPEECLHLMSLMSVVGERSILVDLPWIASQTVELLRARGFDLIEIDPGERDTLCCNVLALGDRKLLAFEENPRTNDRLRSHGFEVATFPGAEIGRNGGGGPTCLTRPLLRA
jgi:N-dimethylarginine dimethylaminohydrolase